jgi:hypothetical protein
MVYQRTKFTTRYTAADVGLLAYVDKPQPRGEPGFLRIDTVRQGDQQ